MELRAQSALFVADCLVDRLAAQPELMLPLIELGNVATNVKSASFVRSGHFDGSWFGTSAL